MAIEPPASSSTPNGVRCTTDPHQLQSTQGVSLGLLMIEGIELAVPTHYLREAIDMPPTLSKLLSTSVHVAGAVDLRDELIAVVDLRHALGLPPKRSAQQRIVIIHHRGYVFGVIVDALGGVITVPEQACQTVEVLKADQAPLIRQVFSIDEGRRVISVLCLEGVMHQTDVPLTRAASLQQAQDSSKSQKQWTPYLLFETDDTRMALHADMVDTVIDLDGMGTTFQPTTGCLGVVQTDTRKLAVLDPLSLLGLGRTTLENNRQVLVLNVESDTVGLLVKRVVQIARLSDHTVRPISEMAFAFPQHFDGMVPLPPHGDFLRLSTRSLMDRPEIRSMATIHGRSHRQTSARDPQASNEVYLTYQVGQELATPLRQVREILPFPHQFTPIQLSDDPRVGVFTHRDRTIPMFDLMTLCQVPSPPLGPNTRLLLVDGQRGTLALVVEQVHAIESARWQHAPWAAEQFRGLDALQTALRSRGLLTLGGDTQRGRGVPSLDLHQVVLALEARYAPQRPPPLGELNQGSASALIC